MKLLKTLIFFGMLIFIGCSSRSFIIMDDYKAEDLRSKLFAVAPYNVTIMNREAATDDLGLGITEDIYITLFEKIFSRALMGTSRFDSVRFTKEDIRSLLVTRDLLLNKDDTIKIALPVDKAIIDCDSAKPDYILFLNKFTTNEAPAIPATMIMNPNGTSSGFIGGEPHGVLLKSDYAIWDNVNGRLVSFGHVNARSSYALLEKARTTWENCIERFALSIKQASPFKLKQKVYNGW